MAEFKSFKEFFKAYPINESTLADFSEKNFPFSKFFFLDNTYMYPVKFENANNIKVVFADSKEEWVGNIEKSNFKKWVEIKQNKIPLDISKRLEKKFKPLQNK